MKIATLNINSINARLPLLSRWLTAQQPDIMLLQEIKCEFNNFPFFELQMSGFEAKMLGQKSYNGVAVLSPHPMTVIAENLPNFTDDNARYLEVEVNIRGKKYTIASIYLPNGNPPANQLQDISKLQYKLAWMDAFSAHTEKLLKSGKNVLLGGDFNVIMTPQDVYNPELFIGNALYRPEVWARLQRLIFSGYADVFRTLYPSQNGYTFWDYTGGAVQNDLGMRIDYIFSAPALTDKLVTCRIDKDFRKQEKSSDHTILMAEFED